MKTADFSYDLPKEFIAQHPVYPRDSSRLLVFNRQTGAVEHKSFYQLIELLNPEDLLVINQTRVIQARLFGKKIPTGGKAELLLLRELKTDIWEAMVGGKGIKPGSRLQLKNGPEVIVEEDLGGSLRQIRFLDPIHAVLEEIGNVPLPPYIHEKLAEPERYQTIYARDSGSAAAPTAGLHFTPDLFEEIRNKGVKITEVTLHIGLDTFAPVHEDDPRKHQIHKEWCLLTEASAAVVNQTKQKGGRVIAVGTTSVRTLETAARASALKGGLCAYQGQTDLYILPGFQFHIVDCMLTNFHLPESTLLMMVSAFAGREKILDLYELAKINRYRFYSFGDAMLLE
ncbi:MAG: tRNA preQ1(34) S-adenosylmethionine ribosyltransferase-isomerase QueA [Chloroflexi bacterium]|nr:tRNA preQ1(34) S-adenosylmethionine ribosyltransferase-isomerase QueA [Chloroflexota bacterium]